MTPSYEKKLARLLLTTRERGAYALVTTCVTMPNAFAGWPSILAC